ncbi:MAG: helix-turn-helix domain-containing protein [Candidatus Bruticola sp.]
MARSERITLQEASELSGVSIPTIYRRIRSGELKGAICIDASGKHWELFKSDLDKLTLKRKKRSALSAALKATAELSALADNSSVEVEPLKVLELKANNVCALDDSSADKSSSCFDESFMCELDKLKSRCAELENSEKELQRMLEAAKDEASYWHGRCDQISLDFETLRQVLLDKNNDDQELIWDLREQVADLQENLESTQSYYAGLVSDLPNNADNMPVRQTTEKVDRSDIEADLNNSVDSEAEENNSKSEVKDSDNKNFAKKIIADDVSLTEEQLPELSDIEADTAEAPGDIISSADEYQIESDKLLVDNQAVNSVEEEFHKKAAADKQEISEPYSLNEEGNYLANGVKAQPRDQAHRAVKYEMAHHKGRIRKGRKRIPPLR